ncbi:hypothetical protein, partial [Streptomyces sp. NPDC059122]|uniref:hypothetical protein n=1 Tax=Streptomyces sp. NPDC059122 TaxID=3346732 RepID=UPI00367932D9
MTRPTTQQIDQAEQTENPEQAAQMDEFEQAGRSTRDDATAVHRPFDAEFFRDPHPVYARLRSLRPHPRLICGHVGLVSWWVADQWVRSSASTSS